MSKYKVTNSDGILFNVSADEFDLTSTYMAVNTDTLYVDISNDEVGINQGSPVTTLHVTKDSFTTPTLSTGTVAVFEYSTGFNWEAAISILGGTSGKSHVFLGHNTDENIISLTRNVSNDFEINFGTNNALRIDGTDYNVGINVPTSSDYKFDVRSDKTAAVNYYNYGGGVISTTYYQILRALSTDTNSPGLQLDHYNDTGNSRDVVSLRASPVGTGDLAFSTRRNQGAGNRNYERARITNEGDFGLGITDPQARFHVSDGGGEPT